MHKNDDEFMVIYILEEKIEFKCDYYYRKLRPNNLYN